MIDGHGNDCTGTGPNDIDPTCGDCIQQRHEKSYGYQVADRQWDDYVTDMRFLKAWNEGLWNEGIEE